MCGPLTIAFSLSQKDSSAPTWQQSLYFHGLLNVGRILSYAAIGAGIGALGSVLIAGGQLAGIESDLRRGLAIFTGILLIWMGLVQVQPNLLPKIPLLHPFQGKLHQTLSAGMMNSLHSGWWAPLLLGLTWGLIPCGFLYTAQIKAAETGSLWNGMITMLAFGLGTLPSMLGIGVSASLLSADRRSQLFRMGGWVTISIGLLILLRTGEMEDYTSHGALSLLMVALVARPISRLWATPLRYRRALGVGAFALAVAHSLHVIQHNLNWNLDAIAFMLPEQQAALWAGMIALALMTPAAITSCDRLARALGRYWRWIHLLNIPALILGVGHTLWIGSHYFGTLEISKNQVTSALLLASMTLFVLLVRQRWIWSLLSLERFYAPVLKSK
ncbi:sulfite exporter TauE/SafE family protein [Phormidium sp. CLA17]|nr:sulfite exporter TauE/SafE family protein [Leptolyngbya sp. Cla-17]